MLIDSFKRKVDYLRISVTDRCNLRCIYCVPPPGMEEMTCRDILSYEELLRIARIAVGRGVTKIRITGGEPLVRKGILNFLSELSKLEGLKDLSLTTNGVFLRDFAKGLVSAGVRRINISLDTLVPDKYERITGGDHIYRVLEGIEEAERAGMNPVKINMVVIKGLNDEEIVDFAMLTKKKPYHIRFIEYMPFEAKEGWKRERFLSTRDIMKEITRFQRLIPVDQEDERTGPARLYRFEDGVGVLGFISPVSEHFCSSCNRLRLTADGKLRTCLFSDEEIDLKEMMRRGCSDKELEALLFTAVRKKPEGHRINEPSFKKCSRGMNLIGG